ncbi:MAG TPA: ABC transporter transmembrane domain-containing protein, partial [Bacteriovoracaceae bacterium]|nr:ABC transporter transmembrane domain-containing protein [Bacteriovoracaceae bacterium]
MFKTLFFSRVTPLIKKGRTTPLKLNDFPEVDKLWNPKAYIKEFDELNSNSNLLLQILRILLPQAKTLLFLIFFILLFKMVSPVLIHKLIQTVKLAADGEVSLFYGLSVALSLGLVQLLSAVINQHYVFHSVTSTQSAVNGLNQRIFKAIINKSDQTNKGELINRVSTDSELAGAILWGVGELVQIVLTIVLTSALLFYYLGSVAWVPLIVLSLLFPVSRFFSKKFASIHGEIMSNRDERVGKMSQFLEGIKVIKSFVWEKVAGQEIEGIRQKEIKWWRKLAVAKSFSTGSYLFFNLLVSFLSFALYTRDGSTLSAELAFTCLTLFSFLEPCFRQLPKVLGEISSASVAAKRIAESLDEVKEGPFENSESHCLSLKNVSVEKNNKTLLDNISLDIKEGEKVAIVGQVGSGKTTLINTLLGQHELSQGRMIQSYKNISLVTQDPFLFIGSIAKNITFSDECYQVEKLQKALFASCLEEDLRL